MKPELILPDTSIVTPEILPATPRSASEGEWLRHTKTLLGTLGIAGVVGAANAQAQNDPTAPPVPTPGRSPDTIVPSVQGTQPTPAQVAPTDSQAVPGNSTVPDPGRNPNSPATRIPASGAKATASDIAILNFALGLEYLEADFYARVVAAHQARPYLNPEAFNAAQKLATDEAAHVSAITEIITRANATPVAAPAFKFPPAAFFSNLAFLDTATAMEETGVGAYLGAAPQVQSKDVLKFAASVYGIETRHAGLIRLIGGRSIAPNDIEIPLTVAEVTQRVAPFMA